ncbi:MAG: alpha/beta fold hydrolase [Gammaproteobacteria bacterium]|jgi:phospholipase/carboxylesterase|nr:alpha/beta fold hydrolase [Gammaproteobacteria bacterium]
MATRLELITVEPDGPPDASVIWLHGLGADGYDFEPIVAELGLGKGYGIRFLFPHAPVRPITINAGMEMRGWYDIDEQGLNQRVDERGIRESAAAVAALLDAEIATGIDNRRIVLAGFSQGGAIALHLGLRYPQRLGGILALSTYLPLKDTLSSEADAAQESLSIFFGHGSYDPLIPEALGSDSARLLEAAGYVVEYHTYPVQHTVSQEEIRDISGWLVRRLPPG